MQIHTFLLGSLFISFDAILALFCSNFSNVFDVDHFIKSLTSDVKVIKKLPKELAGATRAVKHFRSWSGIGYYRDEIASLWTDYQVKFTQVCIKNILIFIC